MSEFFLTKTKNGYMPQSEDDIQMSKTIGFGESVKVNYKKSRNIGNHRRYFAFLNIVVENATKPDGSDMFRNVEEARFYMMVKTGNVDYCLVDSLPVIKIKSMAFDAMDEEEFQKLFSASIDVALKDCIPGTDKEQLINQILIFAG